MRQEDAMEDEQFLTELHEIVNNYERGSYGQVIREKASYPYLYHLSEIRQNLIDWIPMEKTMRVLECAPACGALTGKLLEKAGAVTCLAEDEMHAQIIRARCKDAGERLAIVVGEAESFLSSGETAGGEKFDVILLVGGFYRHRRALSLLRKQLAPDGRLFAADANRMGLRYFAGCQEEYGGGYFSGVEGYGGAPDTGETPRCYTKGEYARYFTEAGFGKLYFYYPYPDHKFPSCIYSEDWLPQAGELMDNRRNFDRDRLKLFDERAVYDTLLAEGVFETFANSYLIEAYG